jgi:hypothetical protein
MATIYGSGFAEDARDAIVALLNTLQTTMASGYDPTFSYLYGYHGVAKLELNAITVGVNQIETTSSVNVPGTGPATRYNIGIGVRVHTDYTGGVTDGEKIARLMSSAHNKIMDNLNVASGFRVMEITDWVVGTEFVESATIGGEIIYTIMTHVTHTQE